MYLGLKMYLALTQTHHNYYNTNTSYDLKNNQFHNNF